MANDTWALSTGFARVSSQIASMGKFVEAADEIRGTSHIPVADVEYALFRRTSEADRRVTDDGLLALVPSNYLLPAAGDVILGVGRSKEAVRATLGYGPWGGHHHYDTLAMGLDMFGQELLSDIGYTHTRYREWATTVGSHNTVVVDGREQTRESGRLLGYRPASRTRVGFVCAEAAGAFENTTVYRRTMMLVPTGPNSGYVVDLFEVKGGDVHDYLLHGSADFDQTISTEVGLRAAEAEMILGGDGTDGALYGYLKRTRAADVSGDFNVRFEGGGAQVDVRFLGVKAGRLLISDAPSIRRTREDDGKLDDFWLRTVCLAASDRHEHVRYGYRSPCRRGFRERCETDGAGWVRRCAAGEGTRPGPDNRDRSPGRGVGHDPARWKAPGTQGTGGRGERDLRKCRSRRDRRIAIEGGRIGSSEDFRLRRGCHVADGGHYRRTGAE